MRRPYILKKFLLLILLAFLMGSTGCSAFVRRETWPAVTANTDCIERKSDLCGSGAAYTFQREAVTLTLNLFYVTRIISWGPFLLPIIPHLHKYTAYVPGFCLEIESPSETTMIDLSQVELKISNDKSVRLQMVHAGTRYEIPQKIQIDRIVVSKGGIYTLTFEPFDSSPQEFYLDLGNMQTNDDNIRLPPLKFSKRFRCQYYPFYFDHLGEALYGDEK